jgi:hypothetical protein
MGHNTKLRLCPGSFEFWENVAISRLCLPKWPSVQQVAVLSGIPIAEGPLEEHCRRAWVVNIESGRAVASVMFDDGRELIDREGVRFTPSR